jgi:vanillate O-demethylase ferredoxin subunit
MTTTTRRVRIARKTAEAHDVCSFELVDVEARALPAFSAGSHIDVQVGDGQGTGGLVRQYSLCNDPRETHRYLIAVLRDPNSRGGSVGMHALQVGMTIHISEPKNHFALAHDARHSILLAGGIGITPILCMAERLGNIGAPFELHYCTRSPERTAFVERIRGAKFARQVQFHHDDGPEAQKLDAHAAIAAPADSRHLYVCGPTGFMDWVLGTARELGWPEERLHREYFAAGPIDTSHDGSFEVQIASTGAVIRIAPEQSVVAALAAAGVEVPTSCEQGVCGTCLTRVIEGTPEHRDMYLTPDEQAKGDQFTPCCSRAKSARLVLDL